VHYPSLDAWIWPLTGFLTGVRPRLILSFHGLDLKAALQTRGVSRLAWRRLLGTADHIILCSDSLRDSLQSRFPHLAGRLRVIENGVDRAALERIAVQPPAHVIPSPFLFSVGTYEWKKGHDVLIQAFAEIAHRFPDLSLVIAGRYERDEYARLDALRSTLSLADRVHLLIDLPHEETMRLMSRANAFVLASREEPFGIVLLEAGIFRLPVIATTVCGALKHLQTGSELIAVPPEDVHQLAKAMTQVLSDGQTSQAMGKRLGEAVSARLDWTRIIESYASLSARASDQSE